MRTADSDSHPSQRLSARKGGCVWRTTSCVARVVSWDGCDRCSTSQRRISQRRNPIQHTGIGMIFGFLLKTRVCRHCELQKGQLGLSFGKGRGIRTKGGAAAVPEEESHISRGRQQLHMPKRAKIQISKLIPQHGYPRSGPQ